MHAGSWESTARESFEWHEAKPSAAIASRVLDRRTAKSWSISFRTLSLPLYLVFIRKKVHVSR